MDMAAYLNSLLYESLEGVGVHYLPWTLELLMLVVFDNVHSLNLTGYSKNSEAKLRQAMGPIQGR